MSTVRIQLFGRLQVRRDDQVLETLTPRKVQELIAYLVLYRSRCHRRENLASLLWNNSTTAQSLKYLRQALWQLQTSLDSDDGGANKFLLVDSEWVRLNPMANLDLDVAVFERAFDRTCEKRGRELDAECFRMVQNAIQLYQGDLLEGWYQEWCLYERERLQNLYLAMLDKLMDYCEIHQEYEAGKIYGSRALSYDRARERTHRRLMRLSYLAGDRTGALRQFNCCATALEEELGVQPASRTKTLYEQIRADYPLNLNPPPASPEAGQALPPFLPEIVNHLKQFHTLLINTQQQIEENIQALEQILRN